MKEEKIEKSRLKNLEKKIAKKKTKKQCYPLSFSILGGHYLTRDLQPNRFQNPGGVA